MLLALFLALQSVQVDSSHVRQLLTVIAADSMEGRGTGTRGSAKAAKFIAEQFAAAKLKPAGDTGYFQYVPIAIVQARRGVVPRLYPSFAALDTVPASRRATAVNVIGILPGSDPALGRETILVDAHYDHLGMRSSPGVTDSIYNGADDDGSGTVAVMEIALAMSRGPAPRRTIIFATTTGEEEGLLGTQWYIQHPVVPLESMVANLEIEMIGRPDSLAGGPGRGWLTGYARSTMGDALAAAGIPIVTDKRLDQEFFQRSDNIAFAERGIVAHTLSSFNLHNDYHKVTDDVSRIDFAHMTAVIDAAVRAVRLLADGPKLEWKPGGRPAK
jgi:hypothetical protein